MEIIEGYSHLEIVNTLFIEYQHGLGVDLDFQDFANELNTLASVYAKDKGRIFLAKDKDEIMGCIALKPFDETTGEIKRLYVRASARQCGAGQALLKRVIEAAGVIGYQRLVLDTLESLTSAIHLYKRFQFYQIPPYYDNPLEHVLYFEKIL